MNLYTDASGKQGRFAWAFVLESDRIVEGSGLGSHGINQTELMAVLEGLARIGDPSEVTIYSDSVYVIKGTRGGPLRDRLRASPHEITFVKVGKGRPCPGHTRAHHLAREALFS